ncbi:MAG TPA: hypothetical protein VN249_13095, partial [Prolixibacteraceae bacterium]|nr:hypothetical protein [Prolixibacteraceae bacterium]
MLKKLIIAMSILLSFGSVRAQVKEFTLTDEWIQKIEQLAPAKAEVQPKKHHKILVFSLFTGYNHWVIPHTNAIIKVLGEKTGAYETEVSTDIFRFEKENLKQYDAVVLNSTCSAGPRRDLLMDVLDKDPSLSAEQKNKKAAELEANL